MNKLKTVAQALVAASILSSTVALADYKKVTRLGTGESVCLGGVDTPAQFQAWTAANTSSVEAIVAHAGLEASVASAIVASVAKGDFVEKQYAPGTKFAWMSGNKAGVLKSLPKRVWAGKTAFTGYEMTVTSGDSQYEIVVPKACCNFSLASVTKVESKVAAAPATAVTPAIEKAAGLVPFLALMAGSESLKRYEAAWDMNVQDDSGFIGAKLGAKIPVAKGLNLVPALGLISRTGVNDNNTYPSSSANLDLGLEKMVSENMFIGAGVGAYNVNKSDYRESSVFVNVGGALTEATDWFVEGRQINADDSGSAVGAGLRFNF